MAAALQRSRTVQENKVLLAWPSHDWCWLSTFPGCLAFPIREDSRFPSPLGRERERAQQALFGLFIIDVVSISFHSISRFVAKQRLASLFICVASETEDIFARKMNLWL